MSQSTRPDRTAPEGAVCATHRDRPALATCPICSAHACIACWHSSVDRCETCLRRDPLAAAAPIPWELADRGWFARFFGTLKSAFAPVRSAPAFAAGGLRRPIAFALLTFVPLALVRGLIPFTHTLHFGGSFGVRVLHDATTQEIASDVARAMAISLLIAVANAGALIAPYVSLAKAYGSRTDAAAPLRMMMYRLWLLPLSTRGVLFWLMLWALPEEPGGALALLVTIVDVVPLLLLLMAMRATARLAQGVGPFGAFATVLVPLILMALTEPLLMHLLGPVLPESLLTPPAVTPE